MGCRFLYPNMSIFQRSRLRQSRGIFYRNNRKNRYAIRHIGKETKYINLWNYINLRNSSAEGNAR